LQQAETLSDFERKTEMKKININEKFSLFKERWSPKVIAELNGQHVKLSKVLGEFVWHKHDQEDELFIIVKGQLRMEFRDRHIMVGEGEMIVVPRGVEHRPVAEEEVHVMLFEPAGTLNTGDVRNERTKETLEWI
jgi:mannose-6-phosphate isomerase-like protein (cupin superfamily)